MTLPPTYTTRAPRAAPRAASAARARSRGSPPRTRIAASTSAAARAVITATCTRTRWADSGALCRRLGQVSSRAGQAGPPADVSPSQRPSLPRLRPRRMSTSVFCPTCANLLLVEECSGGSGLRFCCATCPYVYNIDKTVRHAATCLWHTTEARAALQRASAAAARPPYPNRLPALRPRRSRTWCQRSPRRWTTC